MQRLLRPILGPLAVPLYAAAIARRNRAFDAGKGVVTLDRPVISVGNLSAGGTGKSPMVAAIIRWLLAAGHVPCIAMRGYGAPSGQGHLSDEALEYRSLFPSLAIVAQPNRLDGLLELFAKAAGQQAAFDSAPSQSTQQTSTQARAPHHDPPPPSPSVVVLDDGFQHRQLARQLDIVLIDATRSPFDDALLPAGLLREPLTSLSRAHALVVTRADAGSASLPALIARLAAHAPHAPVYLASHHWPSLERVVSVDSLVGPPSASKDSGRELLPPASLHARRLFAACAIGNPQAFLSQLAHCASTPIPPQHTLILPDHDPYAPHTIAALLEAVRRAKPEALVVTRKDWVKLTRVKPGAWPCDVLVPQLELSVHAAATRPRRDVPDNNNAPLEDIVRGVASLKIEDDDP